MSVKQNGPASRNKLLLFLISCLAYATIGFHFSIRSNIAGDLEMLFATVNAERAAEMLGSVLGVAFLGYGITIFVISPLIDAIGMGLLMKLSGTLTPLAGTGPQWKLAISPSGFLLITGTSHPSAG